MICKKYGVPDFIVKLHFRKRDVILYFAFNESLIIIFVSDISRYRISFHAVQTKPLNIYTNVSDYMRIVKKQPSEDVLCHDIFDEKTLMLHHNLSH